MVMVTWYEARRLCEVQGKRLCGDDEWTLACEGPQRLPYPYGWARDPTVCNIDHLWIAPNDDLLANRAAPAAEIQAELDRLSQRVPSGSMPKCKSPYGVMDMTGNVDEWAVNVTLDGKPFHSLFKGGHWVSGARNRCRPVTVSHDETTAYYAEGFRCCATPN
jgi:formylglycine-generating enzyme required for sulfatase activity